MYNLKSFEFNYTASWKCKSKCNYSICAYFGLQIKQRLRAEEFLLDPHKSILIFVNKISTRTKEKCWTGALMYIYCMSCP